MSAERERFRREMKMGNVAVTVENRRALDPAACAELAGMLDGLQLDRERVDPGRLALAARRVEALDTATLYAMRDLLIAVTWWFHNEIGDRKEEPAA